MGDLQITSHKDIECARITVKVFDKKLDVCSFYFNGTVIDTGPRRAFKQFVNFFRNRQIKQVLLTHYHEDHSGNAFWFDNQGINIYARSPSLEYLSTKPKLPVYRWYFWGSRPGITARKLTQRVELDNNDYLSVIKTPCHSRDHTAFYFPGKGVLFTGDLFVSHRTKLLMKQQNIYQTMMDLRKVLEYDFDTVCCSHSGIIKDGKEMIRKKLEHLEITRGKVIELYNKGLTAKEINDRLFGNSRTMEIISRGEWCSLNLVKSFLEDKQKV